MLTRIFAALIAALALVAPRAALAGNSNPKDFGFRACYP
jgi:hypothetical protein